MFQNPYEQQALLAHELQRELRLTVGHACARTERRWRYSANPFATSALEVSGWSAPCPGRFTNRERPGTHLQEAGWASGSIWTGKENVSSTGI